MSFTPKSEKELQEANCWEVGVYDFEVIEADRTTSKSGNDMLALNLKIWHPDGRTQMVRDWLVASDHHLCLMKLRHYCRSVGAMPAYESGDLGNFPGVGTAGQLRLTIEEDDQYGARNRVSDYKGDKENPTVAEPLRKPVQAPVAAQVDDDDRPPFDDEVPF